MFTRWRKCFIQSGYVQFELKHSTFISLCFLCLLAILVTEEEEKVISALNNLEDIHNTDVPLIIQSANDFLLLFGCEDSESKFDERTLRLELLKNFFIRNSNINSGGIMA